MKNKKLFTNIIITLMLLFQVTTASAATFSDSYIDKERTLKMNTIISDVLSDEAKKDLDGYNIYIVNQRLSTFLSLNPNKSKLENDMIEGMTHKQDKEIIIHTGFLSIPIAFHEIAHAIDFKDKSDQRSGTYSDSDEYKQIAAEETNQIAPYAMDCNFKTNILEQFADCFSLFVMKPDILKQVAPKTFEYFTKLNLVKEDFKNYGKRTNTSIYLDTRKPEPLNKN